MLPCCGCAACTYTNGVGAFSSSSPFLQATGVRRNAHTSSTAGLRSGWAEKLRARVIVLERSCKQLKVGKSSLVTHNPVLPCDLRSGKRVLRVYDGKDGCLPRRIAEAGEAQAFGGGRNTMN